MRLKAVLSRLGREAVIMREQTSGSDRLNHPTGDYDMVANVLCAYFDPDTGGGQSPSGELSVTNPKFAFASGADIRVNDHIVYDGTSYEVEKLTQRPSHTIALAKQVQ
jgi:hypothetical protein